MESKNQDRGRGQTSQASKASRKSRLNLTTFQPSNCCTLRRRHLRTFRRRNSCMHFGQSLRISLQHTVHKTSPSFPNYICLGKTMSDCNEALKASSAHLAHKQYMRPHCLSLFRGSIASMKATKHSEDLHSEKACVRSANSRKLFHYFELKTRQDCCLILEEECMLPGWLVRLTQGKMSTNIRRLQQLSAPKQSKSSAR